jgi:hypothetical protein
MIWREASVLIDHATGVIMAANKFHSNLNNSEALPEILEQYNDIEESRLNKFLQTEYAENKKSD